MRFRNLDSSDDWEWGNGRASYAYGDRAIDLNLQTALMVFLGEVFWQTDFGIDWLNIIGGKNPNARQAAILQCRQMIITRFGVARINSVTADFGDYRRYLSVTYDITTIYNGSIESTVNATNP